MATLSPAGAVERSVRRVASVALLAVVGSTLVFGAAPAAAVTRTPYNTNLVKNPGFEAGGASVDGNYPVFVPSWGTSGNATVVKYGSAGGFPTAAEGASISGGKKFFTTGQLVPGDQTCTAQALQRIALKGRGSAIDAGRVHIDVSAYLGTYASQPDRAVMQINMNNAVGNVILATVQLTATATNGQMIPKGTTTTLPPGTRSIKIFLYSNNTVGYCDAYFDRIKLKLRLV